MKVAVYGGFYRFHNYGDDMAAILIAMALKEMGTTPVLYRLHPELANIYSLQTTENLNELLTGASFCLIGSGGFLVGDDPVSDIRKTLGLDFEKLRCALEKANCPLYGLSIGGDGRGRNTPLMKARINLIQSPQFRRASVRMPEDREILSRYEKSSEFYPDLLWSAADTWNIRRHKREDGRLHVGIQLWDKRQNKNLFFLLKLLSPFRRQIVLHFIRSYGPGTVIGKEIIPEKESENIRIHRYRDPKETLRFLASMDLLITQKLHMSLTALSVGTPVLSFRGRRKTRAFFRSISAPESVWKGVSPFRIFSLLQSPQKICDFEKFYAFSKMDVLKESCRGHYAYLKRLVEKHQPVGAAG